MAGPYLDASERIADPRFAFLYLYYGDDFKIECPTGSENQMNLFEVARDIVIG